MAKTDPSSREYAVLLVSSKEMNARDKPPKKPRKQLSASFENDVPPSLDAE